MEQIDLRGDDTTSTRRRSRTSGSWHPKHHYRYPFVRRNLSCQMAIARFFRSYVFGPLFFWTLAPLRYAAKFAIWQHWSYLKLLSKLLTSHKVFRHFRLNFGIVFPNYVNKYDVEGSGNILLRILSPAKAKCSSPTGWDTR